MSPGKAAEEGREPSPICPQCGSDDTALILQPSPAASDVPHPHAKAKDRPTYRCMTCRYKWKEGEGV